MITKIIIIDGREIPLAPTPISKLSGTHKATASAGSDNYVVVMIESIWWGIKRANPATDITKEWLDMNIDSHNSEYVIKAFCEVNGFETNQA